MARTAKGEQLRLREMLLRWCDPHLVGAVQATEAGFTADQVDAVCPCNLGGAKPGSPDPAELDSITQLHMEQSFRPVWRALEAELRIRLSIGRIRLSGMSANAHSPPIRHPMPLPIAALGEFDFSRSAVTGSSSSWREVTASLNTNAASLGAPETQVLPLLTAMLTYSSDRLVDEYEMAELTSQIGRQVRYSGPPPGQERLYGSLSVFHIEPAEARWAGRLAPARAALEADFRARVAAGTVELTGLQIAPVLVDIRSQLAPAWAAHMRFDWLQHAVTIEGARFLEVVGRLATRPMEMPLQNQEGPSRTRRGRPGFPEEALIAIARGRLKLRHPSNKAEAAALLAEFLRRHPGHPRPAVRSVQDHVTRIYAAAGKDAASLNPPK